MPPDIIQAPLIDANTLYDLLYVQLKSKDEVADIYSTSVYTIDQYLLRSGFLPPYDNVTGMFAYAHANSAYNSMNTLSIVANSAFANVTNAINFVFAYAVSAYNEANAVYMEANVAFSTSNAAYNVANIAYSTANAAYNVANLANAKADSAYANGNAAAIYANSVFANINISFASNAYSNTVIFGTANAAYNVANLANAKADSAYANLNSHASFANVSFASNVYANTIIFGTANAAYNVANLANAKADSAYANLNSHASFANASFYLKTGGAIAGPVSASGNGTFLNLVANGSVTASLQSTFYDNLNSQAIFRQTVGNNTPFTILGSQGQIYLGTGIKFLNGVTIHDNPGYNWNSVLSFYEFGATWFAGNQGNTSFNLAAAQVLWDNAGRWAGKILTFDTVIFGVGSRPTFLHTDSTIATGTFNLAALEVQASPGSGAAFICFHRPGAWQTYLGLDGTSLKYGGGSLGANAYVVHHDGITGANNTWAPAISASSGTITSTTLNAARYSRVGALIYYSLDITITNAGSGAGNFQFTLPTTPVAGLWTLYGRDAALGPALSGVVTSSGSGTQTMIVTKYDNTTAIATNARLVVQGFYSES